MDGAGDLRDPVDEAADGMADDMIDDMAGDAGDGLRGVGTPQGAGRAAVSGAVPGGRCRALQWGPVGIGAGRPALVVALTGPGIPAAVEQARRARAAGAEVLELRVDLLEEVRAVLESPGRASEGLGVPGRADEACAAVVVTHSRRGAQGPGAVGPMSRVPPVNSERVEQAAARAMEALRLVQEEAGQEVGVPVLLTCRTTAEGGQAPLEDDAYAAFLLEVLEGLARWPAERRPPAVDVEVQHGSLPRIAARAHELGIDVVGSFHDFAATPGDGELEEVLARMASQGADLAKAAVMPQEPEDVARLLGVGARMSGALEIPVAVISMGTMGAVSRVAPVFGSALTFVVVPDEQAEAAGAASAPGQLPIDQVRRCLDLLQG